MHANDEPKTVGVRRIGLGPLGWGLLSLACNVMFLPSLFAWVTGLQTLADLRRAGARPASPGSRWQAWTGVVLGAVWPVGLAAGLIVGILMAPPEFWEGVEEGLAEARAGQSNPAAAAAKPAAVEEAEPLDYLVLPDDHAPSTPVPVLIWLHGYGSSPDLVLESYFERLANRYGLAVLGISGPWRSQPGEGEGQAPDAFRWSEDPLLDARRVQEALSSTSEQLTPEKGRVVLFGFSQGAMVAAELAARDPERYAGAIVLSPGSVTHPAPLQIGVAPADRQHYVISVGEGEHAGNLEIAAAYHQRLRALGHLSQYRKVAGQNDHVFPSDFYRELPRWLERLLRPRGGLVERSTEHALVEAQLTAHVDARVREGFLTREQILEGALDWVGSTGLDDPSALATSVLDRRMEAQAREEKGWPAITDCDRLDRAFAALEAAGILARQNYEDCGTCGGAAILDELNAAREAGRHARGYVFFHMQDTESAVDGGGLYLSYGASEEGNEATAAIGREVVA
ncbi:MAG: alpha/beta hydrolase-fold protein, partial [Myxococcaceae bacterium]